MEFTISSKAPRRQVLVVEDDRGCAEFLATWLKLTCHLEVVGEAHTVAEAKSLLASTRPNLILTDYGLPDGTGAELSEFARHELGDVLVAMLTGDSSEEARHAASAAGVDLYLEKGQPLDQLATLLNRGW